MSTIGEDSPLEPEEVSAAVVASVVSSPVVPLQAASGRTAARTHAAAYRDFIIGLSLTFVVRGLGTERSCQRDLRTLDDGAVRTLWAGGQAEGSGAALQANVCVLDLSGKTCVVLCRPQAPGGVLGAHRHGDRIDDAHWLHHVNFMICHRDSYTRSGTASHPQTRQARRKTSRPGGATPRVLRGQ